jgi:hypothetical protein
MQRRKTPNVKARPVSNLPPKGRYPDRTVGERELMAKGARRAAIIAEEHRHAARWHYLSFADDTGFLGGVIVRSYGFLTAIQRATELGINPGGEVMSTPIPRKDLWRVPGDLRNRLLSEDEVQDRLEGRRMSDEPGAVTVYVPSRSKKTA